MTYRLTTGYYRVLVLVLMFGFFSKKVCADVAVGKPAPAFTLYDQHEHKHSLADYAGKWLVLYFYPKDDTPGCTIEACKFRDDYQRILSLGAEVLGVSLDSTGSHARFASEYNLPFPLLSDPDGKVAREYGCLFKVGLFKLAKRNTFIIDKKGRIARIYRDVDPRRHSEQIITDLQQLQSK